MGAVPSNPEPVSKLVVPILMFLNDEELHFIHAAVKAGRDICAMRYKRNPDSETYKVQHEAAESVEVKFMTGRERYSMMVEDASSDPRT